MIIISYDIIIFYVIFLHSNSPAKIMRGCINKPISKSFHNCINDLITHTLNGIHDLLCRHHVFVKFKLDFS